MTPRIALFVGLAGSLAPVQAAAAARDLATPLLVLDRAEATSSTGLRLVAEGVADTIVVDTGDPDAVCRALTAAGVSAVATFVDGHRPLVDIVRTRLFGAPEGDRWGKDAQRQLLTGAKVSAIDAVTVESPAELHAAVADLGRPVVVKPVFGVASRDLWLVRTSAEQAELAASMKGRYIVEPYIAGPSTPRPSHRADYLSAELFVTSAGSSGFLTERPPLASPCRETGIIGPSTIDSRARDAVLAKAKAAVDAMDAGPGAYHVELKLTDSEPVVIEVNGRLGGYVDRLVTLGTGRGVGRTAVAAAIDRTVDLHLEWHRWVAALFLQAPVTAATIRAAPARRDFARLPSIVAIDHLSSVGETLDWREGTGGAAAKVWLAANSDEELRDLIVETGRWMTDAFEFRDASDSIVRDDEWLSRLSQDHAMGR